MEAEYGKAVNFITDTGQGLMDEGKDITEYVKKLCLYYYELDPILASRASTKPLSMFESEGDDVISEKSNDGDKNNDDDEDFILPDDEPPTPGAEENVEEEDLGNEAIVEGKKKRPLSLQESQSQKKAAKMHSAVQLLSSLSTAIENAATQKLLVKSKEIDERKRLQRLKLTGINENWIFWKKN
jgi:hypothetical protein